MEEGEKTMADRTIEMPMKVHVYCGHYKGQGGYFTEPPECGWEGIVEVEADDFQRGHASTNCQSCGAELTQDMDSFDPVEE